MDAVNISMSGLDVEWQRLQVVAQNLANMNSTRSASGEVYQPLTLVSGPEITFNDMLQAQSSGIHASGVRIMGLEAQTNGVRRTYEPGHPQADQDGFVSYPNVDHAGEMTLMIRASRAYEANLAAVQIAQDMYTRALDIGRQS